MKMLKRKGNSLEEVEWGGEEVGCNMIISNTENGQGGGETLHRFLLKKEINE